VHAGLVIYGTLDQLSGGYLYDRMLVRQIQGEGGVVEVLSLANYGYTKNLQANLTPHWHRQLRTANVNILLQDELNHPSLVDVNRRLRGQVRYPIVSIVHHLRCSEEHPPLLRRLYRQIESLYLNSVDAFIYNSHTTQATVAALLRQPRPGIVAYPAADHLPAAPISPDVIDARALAPGPLRILFVGNLISRKGLHHVLSAAAALDGCSWELSVVGRLDVDDGYTKIIARQIAGAHLTDRVTLHGRLSDAELAAAYRDHHVLAVPSYEGFGIVYVEAMRHGLPVLAATAGAAHEIVTHGADGYLVPPGATPALTQCLQRWATDRHLLAAMGRAALARSQRHPTWHESMGGVTAWLSTLAAPAQPAMHPDSPETR
jgi:glycosyltransferase involved in cell wall biosynthesis